MTQPRELLREYLRQRRQLGERDLFLESMPALELLDLASGRYRPPAPAPQASGFLQQLAQQAAACTRCRLHQGRQNVVFGVGSPTARLVVVGEAPGRDEDRTGLPFVGRAGKLLDQLLLSVGFTREQVYICNVLKCRPPENRDPLPDEIHSCSSFLLGQIELISPRVLLAAGKFAAQTLLSSEVSIGRLRGQVHRYRGVPLVATHHPAFLLRQPQWVRAAWQDFQLARKLVDESA
jgi:uracil-DNA glycosylase family 4